MVFSVMLHGVVVWSLVSCFMELLCGLWCHALWNCCGLWNRMVVFRSANMVIRVLLYVGA